MVNQTASRTVVTSRTGSCCSGPQFGQKRTNIPKTSRSTFLFLSDHQLLDRHTHTMGNCQVSDSCVWNSAWSNGDEKLNQISEDYYVASASAFVSVDREDYHFWSTWLEKSVGSELLTVSVEINLTRINLLSLHNGSISASSPLAFIHCAHCRTDRHKSFSLCLN